MLPDNGTRHAEGQTLDLDVIAELQEVIVAPERSSAQSLPPLTTEQALALLELINKVIRPALESSLQRFEGVFSNRDLSQCANWVAIQVSRNHLPSGLLTGRVLENLRHRKSLKQLIRRLFGERVLTFEPLRAVKSSTSRPAQVIDLSKLDAGETIPASTHGQINQKLIARTPISTPGPGSVDMNHGSKPKEPLEQQGRPPKETGRSQDENFGLPGRPRGRLPKTTDSSIHPKGPAKQQEQLQKRVGKLQDDVVKLPGRPPGRPPKSKDSVVQDKIPESPKTGTVNLLPHVNCEPPFNTSEVRLSPIKNVPERSCCEEKSSHLPIRLKRRQAKLGRQEEHYTRILQSRLLDYSTLSQEIWPTADLETKSRSSRQTFGARATKTETSPSQSSATPTTFSTYLLNELGHSKPGYDCCSAKSEAQEGYYMARTWQQASGDIITGAWHFESDRFIVGATATTDSMNLQYNRPYNLLFGDLANNTLHELDDHSLPAPKPNSANTSKLAMTIETARFRGNNLYTASHDKTVKIWDVAEKPVCKNTIGYEHHASLLEVSEHNGTVAVGIKRTDNAIHVFNSRDLGQSSVLGSSRAKAKPSQELYPSCLAWGTSPLTQTMLLAGFLRWGELPDGGLKKEGHLCLWDVATEQELIIKPSAQGVYTTAWCPRMNGFAAGGIPGQHRLSDYRMQSVVRIWDLRVSSAQRTFEFECPAKDQGEVSFHPRDDNLLVVACTDGASYVYDCRNPDTILHRLSHGDPIENNWVTGLDSEGQTREEGDGGVMLCEWGNGRNLLYTGSSDGALKTWDVHRAPNDVFVRDIVHLDSGITFGKFSPDCSRLLVGDASGGVHIMSNDQRDGDCDVEPTDNGEGEMVPREMQMLYAQSLANQHSTSLQEDNPGTEGIATANKAVLYGQAVIDPRFGALQGPKYKGPYNNTDTHQPIDTHSRAGFLEERRQRLDAARRAFLKARSRVRNRSGSLMSPPAAKRLRREGSRSPVVQVIDITSDTDDDVTVNIIDITEEEGVILEPKPPHHAYPDMNLLPGTSASADAIAPKRRERTDLPQCSQIASVAGAWLSAPDVEGLIQEDLLEEDHWFPDEDPVAIGCFVKGGAIG